MSIWNQTQFLVFKIFKEMFSAFKVDSEREGKKEKRENAGGREGEKEEYQHLGGNTK